MHYGRLFEQSRTVFFHHVLKEETGLLEKSFPVEHRQNGQSQLSFVSRVHLAGGGFVLVYQESGLLQTSDDGVI